LKNFIIDIGNSRIKAGYFEGDSLRKEWTVEDLENLNLISQNMPVDHSLISSVKWEREALEKNLNFPFTWFDRNITLPIKMAYNSPATLGLDRIAAAVGLSVFHPGGDSLGIDAGTCITYECLEGGFTYRGGGISPGLSMRFKAMNGYTARLPLVEFKGLPPRLIGTTTEECMQSGVYFGVLGEIQYVIRRYRKDYPELKVYICGGDATHFESLTKDYIFVIPNLVLYGLNRILTYNVSKS
jgi:type III pantothenate kinase